MIALSIQQPWAWLIVNGYKDIENRQWKYPPSYRGRILIHASKQVDRAALADFFDPSYSSHKAHWQEPLHHMPKSSREYARGGIVGIAILVDVVTKSNSPWFHGYWGFVLKDARPLPFCSLPGRLGLFEVASSQLSEEILQQINR